MQILKSFIDVDGVKRKPGQQVPSEWDKARIEHYARHGMVGESTDGARRGPAEKKPAKPSEAK